MNQIKIFKNILQIQDHYYQDSETNLYGKKTKLLFTIINNIY